MIRAPAASRARRRRRPPMLAGVLAVTLSACQADDPLSGTASEAPAATDAADPVEVWLDVDPAIGLPSAEVDDGLMMLQVFHSPELVTRGVSVVFGNTSLENGVPIARRIVDRFGPEELGVYAGAAGAHQLGEETEAVTAMASVLEESSMTLLAVGPVTNVASLVQLRPDLHDRIESIVMVAARRVGQSFRTGDPANVPHRDFNFELDPDAMQAILDTEIPLVFAPWEVSSKVWLRRADLEALGELSEAGRWVQEQTATWLDRWQENLGVDGFNPFDTLAAGWVTHPQWMESSEVRVWIEEGVDDRDPEGEATKPYLYVAPLLGEEPDREARTAIYLSRPDPRFQELLLERLAGPPS